MAQDVVVKIRAEDDFSSTVNKVKQSYTSANKTIQKESSKSAASMKKLAVAAGGLFAFSKVAGFMKESISLANTQIKSQALLANALGKTSSALQAQASELQKLTLFGDEETIAAQARLAAFVKEEEQIAKLTPLIQDFATAKGVDLATAAELVGKSVGTSINALGRYGVVASGAVGSTERLDSVVSQMESSFGGAAEAVAKAGSGPFKQMLNSLGDMQEVIGMQLLPLVNDFSKSITNNADNLETVGYVIGRVTNSLVGYFKFAVVGINGVILMITKGFGLLVSGLEKVSQALPKRLVPKSFVEGVTNLRLAINAFAAETEQEILDWGNSATLNFKKVIASREELRKEFEKPIADIAAAAGDRSTPAAAKTEDKDAAKKEEARLSAVYDIRRQFADLTRTEKQIELADLDEWYAEYYEMVKSNDQNVMELTELYKGETYNINKKYLDLNLKANEEANKKIEDDDKRLQSKKRSYLKQGVSNLKGVLEIAGKENKKAAKAAQTIAIFETGITAAQSAVKAFNALVGLGPAGPALGAAAAVAALAFGAAQVVAIKSQKLAGGGVVEGNSSIGDKQMVSANAGEMFINRGQQTELFNILNGQNNAQAAGSNVNVTINGNVSDDNIQTIVEEIKMAQQEAAFLGV